MKQILISHRGNISGSNPNKENTKQYILNAIKSGFGVEVDVWLFDGSFYLGHDYPTNKITKYFLINDRLWLHCKNLDALKELTYMGLNTFWHQEDRFTITNHGYILAHSHSNRFGSNIIYMLPEILNVDKKYLNLCTGICSDYINLYV